MGEKEFLKYYMEKRGLNSVKEAKEKIVNMIKYQVDNYK